MIQQLGPLSVFGCLFRGTPTYFPCETVAAAERIVPRSSLYHETQETITRGCCGTPVKVLRPCPCFASIRPAGESYTITAQKKQYGAGTSACDPHQRPRYFALFFSLKARSTRPSQHLVSHSPKVTGRAFELAAVWLSASMQGGSKRSTLGCRRRH